MISPEEATSIELTPFEVQHLENTNRYLIIGTPEVVRQGIIEAAEVYKTTDVSIATNCHYFEDRIRSFELVAQAFNLSPPSSEQLVPEG